MGCKYACVCGGICLGCPDFEPEAYCGEAEDIYDQTYGKPAQHNDHTEACFEEAIKKDTQKQEEKNA